MTSEKPVDYSPLTGLTGKYGYGIIKVTAFIVGDFTIIILGALFTSVVIQLIGYFGIFAGLGLVIYSSIQQNKKRNAALEHFAAVNSWQYSIVNQQINKPGSVFSLGHSKTMHHIFSGTKRALPFNFYTYSYVVGYGKNEQIYDLQVFELTLPRTLPHMVIDSLVESGNGGQSTLPIDFAVSQKIELEGDFSEYFSLYAPDNYGITALTVLAPDVMETLMKFAAKCDIEIIQNKLYFYWPDIPENQKAFQDEFTTVDQVLDQTLKKLTKSDIYAAKNQEMVQSNARQAGGRLIKSWWNSTSMIALYVSILAIAYGSGALIGGDAGVTISFIACVLIMIGGIIYALSYVARSASRARKRNDLKDRKYS